MFRVALLAFAAVGSTSAVDSASCAACMKAYDALSIVLNKTKSELELSKTANDKKSAAVDKVQKAQTKRWLKNEYGVALRAGIEEEIEVLCTRDAFSLMKPACTQFLDEQEDSLPRALIDGKEAQAFCEASVPGCDAQAAALAKAEFGLKKVEKRSEAVPKGKAESLRGGAVTRLVGQTFKAWTRDVTKSHRIVLMHNTSVSKEREAVDSKRYAAMLSEFYAFASAAHAEQQRAAAASDDVDEKKELRLRFGQLNLRKNDAPLHTPLADATGVSILIYLIGERGEAPKSVPAVGEKALSSKNGADAAAVRSQLTQTSLRKCDVCVLVMTELQKAFNATKLEYERSKEYNDKKAQKVDKVQKAQTRRWLKNEYKVELAASVEERLESVCEDESLFGNVCNAHSGQPPLPTWVAAAGGGKTAQCFTVAKDRCRELVEDEAEPLTRAALDEKGHASCAKILAAGSCVPNEELAARALGAAVSLNEDATAAATTKDEV